MMAIQTPNDPHLLSMTIPLTTFAGDIAKYGLEVFWEGLGESDREQIRAVYGNIDSGEPRAEDELAGKRCERNGH